jgi:hypothetical protein
LGRILAPDEFNERLVLSLKDIVATKNPLGKDIVQDVSRSAQETLELLGNINLIVFRDGLVGHDGEHGTKIYTRRGLTVYMDIKFDRI